jgi:hypothetical protein
MAEDWVSRRLQKQREKSAKDLLTSQQQQNARAQVATMFQYLRDRVEADVLAYKHQNPTDQQTSFERGNDAHFKVKGTYRDVTVNRSTESESTVIQWTFVGDAKVGFEHGSVEVAPDREGNIRYKSADGRSFYPVDQVSEQILTPVLFGDD